MNSWISSLSLFPGESSEESKSWATHTSCTGKNHGVRTANLCLHGGRPKIVYEALITKSN